MAARNSSPLLINEHPLQVLPTLAVLLGLNEAMILQQIHFWLCNKDKRCKPYINESESWVYNTYEEWHEQFPFWSVPTIKRAILKLEEKGILITRQFDLGKGEARKYYRIDHEKLTALLDTPSDQFDPMDEIKLIPPSDQIDPIRSDQIDPIYKETENPENTAESAPPPKSVLTVLLKAYEQMARDIRDLEDVKNAAISLEGDRYTVEQVDAWLATRRKLSGCKYIAKDFRAWVVNEVRANVVQMPVAKKYACSTCQDSGSISVFENGAFARYADCQCQTQRRAA